MFGPSDLLLAAPFTNKSLGHDLVRFSLLRGRRVEARTSQGFTEPLALV